MNTARSASFTLSAFGDEIADDLKVQLTVLSEENIRHLEFRGAWGQNILDLDDQALQQARALLRAMSFNVSAIASPIGKSDLDQPRELELGRLERAMRAAEFFGTRLIRVFSFYVPTDEASSYRDEVLERMTLLARRAQEAGFTLLHENEKGIYGSTPQRCHDLLSQVNSPALRLAFDPANFVQEGVRPLADGWALLADYTDHIHIKDAVLSDGSVRPAGQGDGEIPLLLATLVERGYRGFLTLEPHLKVAGPAGGHSGPDGMRTAIAALRELLQPHGARIELR